MKCRSPRSRPDFLSEGGVEVEEGQAELVEVDGG